MQKTSKQQQIMEQSQAFYKNLIDEAKPTPAILNTALTSNPFIKDKDSFKFLKYQLAEYNKRVLQSAVRDPYEILSFQKLHSMLSDLAQIDSRQDQIRTLQELTTWFKEQQRLIHQRSSQGEVRHEMTRSYRLFTHLSPEKSKEETEQELPNIPFYLIERIIDPYRRNWRTIHSEIEYPSKRLKDYKRKVINITNLDENRDEVKSKRVLYPMPPKYEPPVVEEEEIKTAEIPPQATAPASEIQPQQSQIVAEPSQIEPAQPDMGGFGEQPGQPDEQEPPEDVPDKLRPKNPIFIDAVSQDKSQKYKQGFQFYLGTQSKPQRNLQQRNIKNYQSNLKHQRQDQAQIELVHDWAKRKSKLAKDMQKRLEEMKFKANITISDEYSPPQEKLSAQDELKYGFTTVVRAKSKAKDFDLSYNELPRISKLTLDEKMIRSDRLSSLRSKFGKILNLAEEQTREPAPSLCQIMGRRRGFSQIIKNHSQSKERLNQLEEVNKIKERLSKAKVSINFASLTKGLCLPENAQSLSDLEQKFPGKDLPSNPNLIETKKKKKKKK